MMMIVRLRRTTVSSPLFEPFFQRCVHPRICSWAYHVASKAALLNVALKIGTTTNRSLPTRLQMVLRAVT
eukprot:2430972-Pyramimonas_sp.AAC.1